MKKRILLVAIAIAAVAFGVVGMSAFEAHVINVTATIENALNIPVTPINYGTVFPQEQLDRQITVALSDSFSSEGRVDDVSYIIRQKPKCAITNEAGTVLIGPTATGHILFGAGDIPYIDCGNPPRQLTTGEIWGVLPSLCPYLSKHLIDTGETGQNQTDVPAFHDPYTFFGHQIIWNEAHGYLTKDGGDLTDTWNIDLKVPCFGGQCAQDWAKFVTDINPTAIPAEYTQPTTNEHKVFGCDLWFEVTGVSEANGTPRGELSVRQSTTGEALAEQTTLDGVTGSVTHLKAARIDDTDGDEARLVIQASEVGISTLDDLDTISWDAFGVTGYAPHVDVIVDKGAGVEDALVFEYAKLDPAQCDDVVDYPIGNFNTFKDKGSVNSGAYAWLSSGPAGTCGSEPFDTNHNSLAEWKVGGPGGINGTTPVLRLEIEVDNWIESSEAYIQNVLVNGS